MKIRGVGRINKYISRSVGAYNKKKFEKYIYTDKFRVSLIRSINCKLLDIEIVTFVNSENISDLILSIVSFLNSVGEPLKWNLYLDNFLTDIQMATIKKFSFINIYSWYEFVPVEMNEIYSTKWQLRKFAVFSNHEIKRTTIFTDSDVLFYPEFRSFLNIFKKFNWYLPEPPEACNYELSDNVDFLFNKEMFSVNAGFLILNSSLNWNRGIAYLTHSASIKSTSYFLDQTALNLVYAHDNSARILDPRVFHATANDHFSIRTISTIRLAIRHYVGLIRHKMWQLGWKKYIKQ